MAIKFSDAKKLVTAYNGDTGKSYRYGHCECIASWLNISIKIDKSQKSPISVLWIEGSGGSLALSQLPSPEGRSLSCASGES